MAEFAPAYAGLGEDASVEAAGMPADVVLNGITGAVGLRPTLAALDAGTTLALANKESLIIGGPVVHRAGGARPDRPGRQRALRTGPVPAVRHAAEVRRLVLTASGGPFRGRTRDQLADVTVEEALAHPTWAMGPVVTINSATLVNKGLEVIEAHLLFGIPFDRIEVVVHPTSVVHSMVEFVDGSTLVQASPPTMLIPIALGLAWPDRIPDTAPAVDWTRAETWEFHPLDDEAFPAVALARLPARPAGPLRRSTTLPTRSASGPSATADWPSSTSCPRSPPCSPTTTYPRRSSSPSTTCSPPTRGPVLLPPQAPKELMTAVYYLLGVVIFVVAILASIGLHEFGHMIPAKKFGGKVTQWFIGFGPTVWSKQIGETEYGVKAIPLGGYVKIVGMLPPGADELDEDRAHPVYDENGERVLRVRKSNTGLFTQLISDARAAEWEHVKPGDEDRLFYEMAWWKKVIVMAGGPTVNILIAFLIFLPVFALYGNANEATASSPPSTRSRPAWSRSRRTGGRARPPSCGRTRRRPERPVSSPATGSSPSTASTSPSWEQLQQTIRANDDGAGGDGGRARRRAGDAEDQHDRRAAADQHDRRHARSRSASSASCPSPVIGSGGPLYTSQQMGGMTVDTLQAWRRCRSRCGTSPRRSSGSRNATATARSASSAVAGWPARPCRTTASP